MILDTRRKILYLDRVNDAARLLESILLDAPESDFREAVRPVYLTVSRFQIEQVKQIGTKLTGEQA